LNTKFIIILYIMKGKRIKIKCKLFPKIYKQIGIVALIAFAVYIGIKTVQTQQRKKFEGFKEGLRDIKPRDENNNNSSNNNNNSDNNSSNNNSSNNNNNSSNNNNNSGNNNNNNSNNNNSSNNNSSNNNNNSSNNAGNDGNKGSTIIINAK
jgi:hypothetical protein